MTNTIDVENNAYLRKPQKESYLSIEQNLLNNSAYREFTVILPVGCGKTGTITITPFAAKAKRVLVIAPNLKIANQLTGSFKSSNPDMFYKKVNLLKDKFPIACDIRGLNTNFSDVKISNVVITNIQQLQDKNSRWFRDFSADFFDLIIFDEGHHSIAPTYEHLKQFFPKSKIINFTATPERSDGRLVGGQIIYSYRCEPWSAKHGVSRPR
ncbi:DEAD/DEAH box helicase family protein [Piscirickettsia salmonis]|uniref:DEAD/DEAH box helicase family protein n=1 Tax=Piscirickettsia salmonis TaxID=1238 RepID=UPI001E64C45B|nr:DEAD/DEAH box helicase family protein [Piscirickettsia salmonis]